MSISFGPDVENPRLLLLALIVDASVRFLQGRLGSRKFTLAFIRYFKGG